MLAKFIDNAREDSLTAAVFSHLLHLPSEVFWQILRKACYTESLPDNPGEPKLIPWPNWRLEGTVNSDRVIPDLFIRFHHFDLIVEAKRWDNDMQGLDQWKRELSAYTNEYGKEKREVRLLALGGIHSEEDQEISYHAVSCPVHMCRWRRVLLECQRLKRELEEANIINPSSRTSADIRILDDLIALFATHGFMTLRWFDDFDFASNLLDDLVDSDQQYFRNVSLKFQHL